MGGRVPISGTAALSVAQIEAHDMPPEVELLRTMAIETATTLEEVRRVWA